MNYQQQQDKHHSSHGPKPPKSLLGDTGHCSVRALHDLLYAVRLETAMIIPSLQGPVISDDEILSQLLLWITSAIHCVRIFNSVSLWKQVLGNKYSLII